MKAREKFFVELMPDYDQKKTWERIHGEATRIGEVFNEEMGRQVQILKTQMAKNLYLEAKVDLHFPHSLDELAVLRVKEAAYDTFKVKKRKGRTMYPIELDQKQVHFSVMEKTVRVPYLGVVRHRGNSHIMSGSEESKWLMSNVTSMRLEVKNNHLGIMIDVRDNPTPKAPKKKAASRKAKSSRWLE